jgi:hypothetical protein
MKRDFDLVRMILQEVEGMPPGKQMKDFTYPEVEDSVAEAHVVLLIEAGLLDGTVVSLVSAGKRAIVTGLTWAGHDFLDSIKDEGLWSKAKETVLKPAGGVAFSVLLDWAKAEASKRLGLS